MQINSGNEGDDGEREKELYRLRLATASRSMNIVIHRGLCCVRVVHHLLRSHVSYVIPMFSISFHQHEETAVK